MRDANDFNELNILTDEEVVLMAREGSNSAYDILISKYKDFAKTIARKYYINGADNEDVVQEGMTGIFKAIRDFDADGKVPFKSFAALCIERQIQTAVSGANREKHKILNESIPLFSAAADEDETNLEGIPESSIADTLVASKSEEPEKFAMLKETFIELSEISKESLSGFEIQVFNGLIQGKTYKEIADELAKAPKSIDNAIQRIKKKIGFALEKIEANNG